MRTGEKRIKTTPTASSRFIPWSAIGAAGGIISVLIGFASCSSAGSHHQELPVPGGYSAESHFPHEPNQRPAISPANQESLNLYEQMRQQGNYSDAAILQSLQEFTPRSPRMSAEDNEPGNTFPQMSASNLNFSGEAKETTLGAGWHIQVGWKLILDGNYPAAEAAYRQALRHQTGSAEAYLGLGMALMFQGKREQAILAYEEALIIHPSYAAALVHLGYAYADSNYDRANNHSKARSLFQQAYDLGDPFALLALRGLQENPEGI